MFEIRDKFYLDGKPFQIVSGAIHYFRVVPEYWRDRLEKLKAMGCNTVETYIPWNFHEPEQGEFLWEGMHDVCKFLETANELGLYVIVRPSPYICAEWEFGGLPAWLLRDSDMRLRCSYKPYLDAVKAYYKELIPRIAPYQTDRGGSVIMVQIENEYGYYGNDTAYLKFLADTMREYGITVPFVTSDGPWNADCFRAGQLDGALPTGNFGSSVKWQFDVMKGLIDGERPLMCMEFWVGWFDAWGEQHHTSDLEKNKEDLDELMRRGNLNFYMFEGGTNFGFMNGCNAGAPAADVTSYDYDGILTEDGQITEKYKAFREIIGRYRQIPEVTPTTEIVRKSYGSVPLKKRVGLFSVLKDISEPIESIYPISMEQAGQNYGYILYRAKLPETESAKQIMLEGAADRVQAFENGKHIFTASEVESDPSRSCGLCEKFEYPQAERGAVIDLLVENCGRVNFGTGLEEQRKGLTRSVRFNEHRHFGYEIYRLPLDGDQLDRLDLDKFAGEEIAEGAPSFSVFDFTADELGDTFLKLDGFGKGCAFINGFNLGRFWEIGPQDRLYIPAPLIRLGDNRIVIFETEGRSARTITLE